MVLGVRWYPDMSDVSFYIKEWRKVCKDKKERRCKRKKREYMSYLEKCLKKGGKGTTESQWRKRVSWGKVYATS